MIEITELYKFYGEQRAVGPLSAKIERGEIVGLLGLNGAGKTTTLRILSCDLLPSSGTVVVDGDDVVERPDAVRAKIGYLPDTPPLYPEMTVRAYLRFVAALRGVAPAQLAAAVLDAARQTGLEAKLDDTIETLSHGYRQRVGIAQAIVHRPALVVLDEPIAGLDPVQIMEMRELIRGLRGAHTVLLSSHILSEISETCDRLFVLKDGAIVAQGTEAELSAALLGGMRVEVQVRGDADLPRLLAELAEVTEVRAAGTPEPGVHAWTVHARQDVRERLCQELVRAGVPLVGLSRGERELEAIFERLVTAPAATAPTRPEPGVAALGEAS